MEIIETNTWILVAMNPILWKNTPNYHTKYTEEDIIKKLKFLVNNMFVVFAGKVFRQKVDKLCPYPLLHVFVLIRSKIHTVFDLTGKKLLAFQFNFTYSYNDDVFSITNPNLETYIGQIYPTELEIKDTIQSNTSASYL